MTALAVEGASRTSTEMAMADPFPSPTRSEEHIDQLV